MAAIVARNDGKVVIRSYCCGVHANDDDFANKSMRHGVEIGTYLRVAIGSDTVLAPGRNRETLRQGTVAPFLHDQIVRSPVIQCAWPSVEFIDDRRHGSLQFLKRSEGTSTQRALENANAVLDSAFGRWRSRANGVG